MKKTTKGFTLVEIMIVIAILGMLSVAGFSSYVNTMRVSRDATRKTNLETIRQALEMYKSDNSTIGYPNNTGNAKAILGCSGCVLEPYISAVNFPQDPQNSTTNIYYYYARGVASSSTYILGTVLENVPAINNCGAPPPDCHISPSIPCNFCVTQP